MQNRTKSPLSSIGYRSKTVDLAMDSAASCVASTTEFPTTNIRSSGNPSDNINSRFSSTGARCTPVAASLQRVLNCSGYGSRLPRFQFFLSIRKFLQPSMYQALVAGGFLLFGLLFGV